MDIVNHTEKAVATSRMMLGFAWIILLVAAVVLLTGCQRNHADETTSSAEKTEVSAPTMTDTAVENTESADSATTEEVSDAQTSDSPVEDARAAEFAVDPARTEWNYDPGDTKTVYLTFDDGPSAHTQEVLDILARYDIKATFFVTGLNPDYLSMIGECYSQGHTIGMHTYSHDYAAVYASTDAYWNDLNAIADVVREQIGYVPCFIRFPGGSSNTISANYCTGIMTELAQEVLAAGYQYYDWDASCGDGAVHTADELVDATIADTSYGYTSIVFLMHDGADKATTVEALPRIIEYFQDEGYIFAPLDRNTPAPHHGIGN